MSSFLERRRRSLWAAGLFTCTAVYFLAYQAHPSLRFGIGRWDAPWLADERDFYPPVRMEGPLRHPDGSVEVKDFVGRLTKRSAAIQIPYHALRSPLRLRLRCHRFGLEGTVGLAVNGEPLGEYVFAESSYPWGGIETIVPQEVAEKGPLRIELRTTGGRTPPAHLPADLGVGLDWIEVAPMSRGAVLLPTAPQWLGLGLLIVAGGVFAWFLGLRGLPGVLLGLVPALGLVAATAVLPSIAGRLLPWGWLALPVAMLWIRIAELANGLRQGSL